MLDESQSIYSDSGSTFDLPESFEKKLQLNVPAYFSQTLLARSNSSIFAQKLNQLSESQSNHQKYRTKWLQILRDYSKLNSLYPILYYAYDRTVPQKYFDLVKTKYLRIWSSKCKKSSNRQMWLKIGQLLKRNSYKNQNNDDRERLTERRISIATKYLTSQKQYQPNYDFFVLNAIPTITSNMKRRDEIEEQEERENDDLIKREILFDEQDQEQSPIKKKRKKVSNKHSSKPKTNSQEEIQPVISEIQPEIKQSKGNIDNKGKSKHSTKVYLLILLTSIIAFAIGFLLPFCFYRFDVGSKISNLFKSNAEVDQKMIEIDEIFPDEDIEIDHYYYYIEEDFDIEDEPQPPSFFNEFITKMKNYSFVSRVIEFFEKKENETISIEDENEQNETNKYEYTNQIMHELKYKISVATQNQQDSNQTKQLKREIKVLRNNFIGIEDEEERNISIVLNQLQNQIENKENQLEKAKEAIHEIVTKSAEKVQLLEEEFQSKIDELLPIQQNEEEIKQNNSKIDANKDIKHSNSKVDENKDIKHSNSKDDENKEIKQNEGEIKHSESEVDENAESDKTIKKFKKSKLTPQQRKEKHINDMIEKITHDFLQMKLNEEHQIN